MVRWQLCTLEHLITSGFGHPFPRHGLQLLFWFANHCVTCELENSVEVMKLVSDCQPETGVYGFHLFGNMEELLPVLHKPKKRKRKKQFTYFEVGNLNTETYPSSANLPAFVRENYGFDGDYSISNMDRIIISYQAGSGVVETVYVTEHDDAAFGRFRPDRTHKVSSELVRALQNPQLDISSFLIQMGYYGNAEVFEDAAEMYDSDPATQLICSMMQNDHLGFFSEAFSQHLGMNFDPFGSDQHAQHGFNTNSHSSGPVVSYGNVKRKNKKPKAVKKPRAPREFYWDYSWRPYKAYDEEEDKKRRGGGGFSFLKLLLGAGALYVAAKCISWWFRNLWNQDWNQDWNQTILHLMPRRTPSYPRTHIMLDYVY
ncbi:uncharacterized protein LOC121638498 [Melanotaenia boesemani]|uniref:uncharacterized protein LOC121638498 n=1 Tax=Melanotaenia boesemani TaxID=1250792 RepID=UPI001C03CF84|nr:uncharacterized protein LOC121638498 [Melanotaenia boesemani]